MTSPIALGVCYSFFNKTCTYPERSTLEKSGNLWGMNCMQVIYIVHTSFFYVYNYVYNYYRARFNTLLHNFYLSIFSFLFSCFNLNCWLTLKCWIQPQLDKRRMSHRDNVSTQTMCSIGTFDNGTQLRVTNAGLLTGRAHWAYTDRRQHKINVINNEKKCINESTSI